MASTIISQTCIWNIRIFIQCESDISVQYSSKFIILFPFPKRNDFDTVISIRHLTYLSSKHCVYNSAIFEYGGHHIVPLYKGGFY